MKVDSETKDETKEIKSIEDKATESNSLEGEEKVRDKGDLTKAISIEEDNPKEDKQIDEEKIDSKQQEKEQKEKPKAEKRKKDAIPEKKEKPAAKKGKNNSNESNGL